MIFNSIEFIVFFVVITHLFFMLKHKYRWSLLLVASCYFYMFFKPIYILILFGTIVIDYFAAIYIHKSTGKRRKLFLVLSIIANVGVLCVFKYYNFFIDNLNWTFTQSGSDVTLPYLNILLPIGLSFHTFQAMSYTIEVYRGKFEPEKHFGIYALYVMFYPQLVAGPIERPQNVLPQFHQEKFFNYSNMTAGLKLMAWGMFKKVVIADRLAIFVNQVYDNYTDYTGISLWIAAIFFSFQIYFDFSGYSDIAIGSARTMGFTLIQNFDRPYSAKSIREFWTRWHISLSTWFKDYLYIPLGGNKVKLNRWLFNILIVFIISGFWHGASWTFIVWGLLHGLYQVAGILISKYSLFPKEGYAVIRRLIVFTLVTIAWVFFRAENFEKASYFISHLFTDVTTQFQAILSNQNLERMKLLYLEQTKFEFGLAVSLVFFVEWIQHKQGNLDIIQVLTPAKPAVKWSLYFFLIYGIVFLGVYDKTEFIYFQF